MYVRMTCLRSYARHSFLFSLDLFCVALSDVYKDTFRYPDILKHEFLLLLCIYKHALDTRINITFTAFSPLHPQLLSSSSTGVTPLTTCQLHIPSFSFILTNLPYLFPFPSRNVADCTRICSRRNRKYSPHTPRQDRKVRRSQVQSP